MNGFADAIVWMWFLPMTLFVVLPLAMLCSRLIWRVIAPRKARMTQAVREVGSFKPEMLANAGV